ncbi:hypothetical protein GUJ93_ZPchr0013g34487 [Zizania palustris]|uniref:DUF569 domain-containing protein n=1 Tax=Zizania palustris TaxID=103762 RepID=A0A8J5WZA6_ZIZPA|nr:hypothetical protein GUJ93_ZPchr0013g34487 [Zizania palustris]
MSSSSGSGDGSRRCRPGPGPERSFLDAPTHPLRLGVAPFESGQYVRLRNRGRGGYLFADESGRGLSIDSRRGMINTVWGVHILQPPHTVRVLLFGAYGRHVAFAPLDAPRPGHIGYYAAQRKFDEMDDTYVMWWTTPGTRGSVVLLNGNPANLMALRANGRYRRWNTGVSLEAINRTRVSSMMEWEVQIIPMRVERPLYQLGRTRRFGPQGRGSQEIIMVNFDLADVNGNINGRGGTIGAFYGRSLIELGYKLEERFRPLGDGYVFRNMTLFIRGGQLGQLFPLLTDLPLRDDDIDIVVFMAGTSGHNRLRFPDVDAE